MNNPARILFVCTGNICRSPLAEALLTHELEKRGAGDSFVVDSAGTDAYHVGDPADPRMRQVARGHGVKVNHRSRKINGSDLTEFDRVYAMDTSHYRTLMRYARDAAQREKIVMFRDHDPDTADADYPNVPDPWYGGMLGFERVYGIVSRTCAAIARELLP